MRSGFTTKVCNVKTSAAQVMLKIIISMYLIIVGRTSVDAIYIVQNDTDIEILPSTAPVILIA